MWFIAIYTIFYADWAPTLFGFSLVTYKDQIKIKEAYKLHESTVTSPWYRLRLKKIGHAHLARGSTTIGFCFFVPFCPFLWI